MTYDILIVGGGPAGYAAALYGARAGLQVAVLEMLSAGGQMATTSEVDNYPGFVETMDGFTLGEQMQAGAERFGAKTIYTEVVGMELAGDSKILHTTDGDFTAPAVILATGANPRTMGLPEEDSLRGQGISYCATCDGMYYRGKTVAVIGGGNSAVEDALVLSNLCEKVYLVHRRGELRAEHSLQTALQAAKNIELVWHHTVQSVVQDGKVTGVVVQDVRDDSLQTLPVDGVFVAIGRKPNTALFADQIACDGQGYVIADETTKTNQKGVFAAGDLRTKPLRQIVTAVADGAVAAKFAEEIVREQARG